MGGRKTANGAHRYRCAPFLVYSPLALPLGELSPQVTERALQSFSNDKIDLCAHTTKISVDIPVPAKPPGIFQLGVIFWYRHCLPSPSSLRSATSPTGRGKGCRDGNCFTTTRLSGGTRACKKSFLTNAAPDAGRGFCTSARERFAQKRRIMRKNKKFTNFY